MPDWKKLIRERLGRLELAPARESEIIEELAQHAEDRFRELQMAGIGDAEAVRLAMEDIGERTVLEQQLRAVEPAAPAEPVVPGAARPDGAAEGAPTAVFRDLRYGLRTLHKNPGLTLVIIALLGIGIGANVAMFTVVDAAFLRPLSLPEPARLVAIEELSRSGETMSVAYPNFVDWENRARSFEAIGIQGVFQETLKQAGGNERIRVGYVSSGFHRAYAVRPVCGRLLTAAEDKAGAQPVAVLSYRFWQTHFGGDCAAVGRTVVSDDQAWTVAGVVPPFRSDRNADLFVPAVFGLDKWGMAMREQHGSTGVVARLRAGVSVSQARTEMKYIAAQLAKQYPDSNGGSGAIVTPLREYLGGSIRQPALLMFGAVELLLLVACANVAGLLLARAAVRQREMAIRIALGASRSRLVRQLLTESLLLALGGAGAGLLVARFSLAGLLRIFPAAENLGGVVLDARVFGFSVLLAVLTAVLFGLAPAVQLTRPGVAETIKAGGRSLHGTAIGLRLRKFLVVGQVALSVVLLVGAGLLVRSLLAALKTDPGFRPEHLVIAAIVPPDRKDIDLSANARLFRDVREHLAATPGVEAVGSATDLHFDNADAWGDFYRDDQPVAGAGKTLNAMKSEVSPGFFRAMGIPLIKGRLFNDADGRMPAVKRDIPSVLAYLRSTEMVCVINESMARRFWPGEDPIGKSFRFGPPSLKGPRVKILGIVGDARQLGLDRPVEPQYFFSTDQFPALDARLVVRTSQDVSGIASIIRKTVATYSPDAAVTKVETMETVIGRTLQERENNVALLGLFSGVALLLAALGLYATMAYMVAQRTQEIGVRMALGAAASDVRAMVVREGAILAGAGIAMGLVASMAGARVVANMLYAVTTTDALAYAGSTLPLIVVMLTASFVPAWRASRVDPMAALRCE